MASSRVTRPEIDPNSFTTIATWMPRWAKAFISGGTSNTSLTTIGSSATSATVAAVPSSLARKRSRRVTRPTISSPSSVTGKREYGLAENSASASAIGVDASIVTRRRRGVMISRTTRLVTERAPVSILRSSESISPPAALSRYRPASSVGECTWEWEWSMWSPSQRMMAKAEPLKTATSGRSSHWLIRIGVSVAIANVSGYRSATVLGSSSPSTTCSAVMNSSTTTTAIVRLALPNRSSKSGTSWA